MIASIILLLYLIGISPLDMTVDALYIAGALLLLAEIGVASLGVLALNGLLALYAAYAMQTGQAPLLGLDIGWSLFFGIAILEFTALIAGILVWKKLKTMRTDTGPEGMIGQKADILKWEGKKGRVQYEGEAWDAVSEKEMNLEIGDSVTIKQVRKLTLDVAE